jgi:hypothetical protein
MEPDSRRSLSWQQAYEATYRYIARYYQHERLKPILRLLESTSGQELHSDRGVWTMWEACVRETLEGSPLPDIPEPWE